MKKIKHACNLNKYVDISLTRNCKKFQQKSCKNNCKRRPVCKRKYKRRMNNKVSWWGWMDLQTVLKIAYSHQKAHFMKRVK